MKILNTIDSLNIGGAEKMSINIVNTISKYCTSDLLIFRYSQNSMINFISQDVKVISFKKRGFFDLKYFLKYRRIVIDNNYDLIHAHSSTIIWAILIKLSGTKVKVLWHDHYGKSNLDFGFLRTMIKYFSNKIDYSISVNSKLYEWSQNHLTKTKKSFINNFPLLNTYNPNVKRTNDIVLLANFREQKDHFTFLKAIYYLKTQRKFTPNFFLIGAFIDNDYVKRVKKFIKDSDLKHQCKFIGPSYSVNEKLSRSLIGVLSSKSEGLPVSLLEYGICGLLPITSNVGECKNVIGKCGFVFEPGNFRELSEIIHNILKNESQMKNLAKCFSSRVKENYGPSNFKNKYFELLNL